VNPNTKSFLINLPTIRFWLTLIAVVWLLGFVGLGWLVKSVVILTGLLLLTPVVAFFGFRWWVQRNFIQGECPVCGYGLVGLNKTQTQCPSCSEPIKIEDRHFYRLTPPGTIDVQAVEVAAQSIDE
jgi:hypothetical protein